MEICYVGSIHSCRRKGSLLALKGKSSQDRKTHYTTLEPGDRGLVRNLSKRGGPGKLRAYWEDRIHVVVERKGESAVYEVKPEGGDGKKHVVHRNLLLLSCDFVPVTQEQNSQAGDRNGSAARI